ncbi:MAG: hypothetical protein ABIR66_13395 [Saprospiraceae bacterium]
MKVWKTGVHAKSGDIFSPPEEDPIRLKKVFYGKIFVTELMSYFKNRNYGVNVQEILYREFCLPEGYEGKLVHYEPRGKSIDCAIVEDYIRVLKMNNTEYGKYLAELYLDRTNQFSELKIEGFDIGKYVEDLKEFFKENMLL